MEDIYKFLDYAYLMEKKQDEKERLLKTGAMLEVKIAVLCGSTFGIVEEFLELFLLYYGIKPVYLIGEYNRFYEEACFSNEVLKSFSPDIILIHVTNKNLLCQITQTNTRQQQMEQERWGQIWEALEKQYHCIIIQNNFEYFLYRLVGNSARTLSDGNIKFIDDMNGYISSYAREKGNFYINDIHFLSSYIGLKNWYDERLWNLYKYPIKMLALPYYALSIANIIKSIYGKNKKTIIMDLDNTLWGGTIGEDGVENIKLGEETAQGESYALLHKYMKHLTNHGVILNICSKNEYEIGISGIRSRKSTLKEEDFAVKKINWNEKYQNIIDILNELNLLEDSAIFIDDDSMECDSIRKMLPAIEVVQVDNVDKFLEKMDTLSFFEITKETNEDMLRNKYYKQNMERENNRKLYKSYEEYLNSLGMVCHVAPICDKNMDRVVQLFNKTNQFNFLTVRYKFDEMSDLCKRGDIASFVIDLDDKFGSNGIVSVAIVRWSHKEAHIDGWIMSCRVFKRGLEFVMLKLICEFCLRNKIDNLHGYYRENKKNSNLVNFYKSIGFEQGSQNPKSDTFEWICRDINALLEKCETNNFEIIYNGI